MSSRCQCIKINQKQCTRKAISKTNSFCWQHQNCSKIKNSHKATPSKAIVNSLPPPGKIKITKKQLVNIPNSGYVPYEQFFHLYSFKDVIGKGTYGEVFASANKLSIVKASDITEYPHFEAFIRELDFYSSFDHPCIFKISHFSYNEANERSYFAMPKGMNIREAYKAKKITLRQIASDLLDILKFLNNNAIAHCDLKPANVVYYDGKAYLIDYGLAKHCDSYQSGEIVFTGAAYTTGYRDPEVDFKSFNSIKCDLYALAKTLWAIDNDDDSIPENNIYTLTPLKNKDPDMDNFLQLCTLPLKQRSFANDPILTKHKIIERSYQSKILETPVLPVDPNCGGIFAKISEWIVEISNKLGVSSRTAFLAVHLIHRSLSIVLPDYSTNKETKTKIQLLGMCCFEMACSINDEAQDYEDLTYLSAGFYKPEEIVPMCMKILASLNGIVQTLTYWDYASCLEDLPVFLTEILKCAYQTKLTPSVSDLPTSKAGPFEKAFELWKKGIHSTGSNNISKYTIDNVHTKYTMRMIPAVVRPIYGSAPKLTQSQINHYFEKIYMAYDAKNPKKSQTDLWTMGDLMERMGLIVHNYTQYSRKHPNKAKVMFDIFKGSPLGDQLLVGNHFKQF